MRWESRAADSLAEMGYWVIQTRGSKSFADMVALKAGCVPVIAQIKAPNDSDNEVSITGREWNGLFQLAELCGATPLICVWRGRPPVVSYAPEWYRLEGIHPMGTRLWPRKPWNESALETPSNVPGKSR